LHVAAYGENAMAAVSWILEAEVTVGTTYPFYDEIFLAGATPPELETVVVGDPSNSEALYYEPTILSEIPAPITIVSSGPERELLPVGDATLSGFAYEDIFLGASWEGFVSGLVETGPGEFSDSEGRCLLLLGTLTPTAIDEGSVTTGFQTPGISVIADGQQIQSEFGNCDTSIAEAAGYGWILEAEVTVGTTYPFYDEIFLAGATPPELETVVVGDPSNSEALYYEPTVLSEIPAP
ncbi:MAG: hypothetical protein OEM40_05000, partial [Acidimicrobiia bacterium]|nr:hypothetical protein [Acidimicrobiia bacterium]